MPRTAPGLRTDPTPRLAELGRQRPEWRAWLGMLGEVLPLLDDPVWASSLSDSISESGTGRSSAADPLLQGRDLVVDTRRLRGLVHRLAEITAAEGVPDAAALGGYRPSADTVVHLLAAAIRHDREGIGELAAAAGVDPGALETVAQLTAVPLLQCCGRLLQEQVPVSWTHGYCPICGSWPLLGEFRSLDRTRRLRCGRCAGDWRINWLRCPYCGERDHERLGSLVLEDKLETLTVETCLHCSGYLKSVTTLQAIPPFELLLWDLETVELDIAALDRGYARPESVGFPLDVRVTARAPGGCGGPGAND
ncbi:MAG: formate dehydrogenase accessory protein FdhE [Gemmatimonadales bacterium]